MKKVLTILALLVAASARADSLDGSKILEQQAQRAQELQQLQHEAEVLKQRAEITRYLDQIRQNGGDVSDLDLSGVNINTNQAKGAKSKPESNTSTSVVSRKEDDVLPTLISIEKNKAAFKTTKGKLYAHVGSTLPGGYKVVSLSMRDGARLQRNGRQYDIDLAW